MTILFGTYSIKVKSIESEGNQYKLFQRVFHIFFIPFFPLARFWKTADGAIVENISQDLYLKELKTKAPIYSYTGILLPILIVAYIALNAIFGSAYSTFTKSVSDKDRISLVASKIQITEKWDRYLFKTHLLKPKGDKYEKNDQYADRLYYTVSEVNGDNVTFVAADLSDSKHEFIALKKEFILTKQQLQESAGKYIDLPIYDINKDHWQYVDGMKMMTGLLKVN